MNEEICKSCGAHLDEFGPSKIIRKGFCPYCVDSEGKIKPYDEVLEGMIKYIEEEMPQVNVKDREEKANEILLGCALWKKNQKVIFPVTELQEFLKRSTAQTWESNNMNNRRKENDGSQTWVFSEDDWNYNDNFFGRSPFAGREVVHYQNTAVWFSSYFGYVLKSFEDIEGTEDFLKEALQKSNSFYRGDGEFLSGDWRYVNAPIGDLQYFTGNEEIFFKGEKAYQCHYHGGLIG